MDWNTIDDSDLVQDKLIDLRSKEIVTIFRTKFNWILVYIIRKLYPEHAFRLLYISASLDLLNWSQLKHNPRNRLGIKDDMHVAIPSSMFPNFKVKQYNQNNSRYPSNFQ